MANKGGKKPYDWRSDLDQIETMRAQGLTEKQVYHCLGISHETFYKYKREQPEFADAIEKGASKGIQMVANALFNNAINGNLGAQCFYLKTRDKENWSEQKSNEHQDGDQAFTLVINPPKPEV